MHKRDGLISKYYCDCIVISHCYDDIKSANLINSTFAHAKLLNFKTPPKLKQIRRKCHTKYIKV